MKINEEKGLIERKKERKKVARITLIFVLSIILISSVTLNVHLNYKLKKANATVSNNKTVCKKVTINNVRYNSLLKYQENYKADKEYFDYTDSMINQKFDFDENGIRIIEQNGEKVYNPVSIAQYALNQYGIYIHTGNEEFWNKAKINADYLLKIQDKENGKFYYNYDFTVAGTDEKMKSPWISAMTQGQVISLFVRIYSITKDYKWIKASKLAYIPLEIDVKDGGVKTEFFGYDYYEEYPTVNPTYTLNGFMFTLIGLHDLYEITNDSKCKVLYDNGIKTLKYCLPFYDSNGISLYHLGHIFAKENLPIHFAENYHRLHIIQLKTLNQFENDATIQFYSTRWENYVKGIQ